MPLFKRQAEKLILAASETGDHKTICKLIELLNTTDVRDYNGNTPLILAARNGNVRTVKTLLGAGANLHARNCQGDNALMLAAREARRRVVSILLDYGAQFDNQPVGNRLALVKTRSTCA